MDMIKENSPFTRVEERELKGEIFQVTHRLLLIPRDIYLDVLKSHQEPFTEIAAQDFVEQYLHWCKDAGGIIGMVRISEAGNYIELDAAVRYRINPLDRPSCHTD
jgi:hypothetical protein